MKKKKLSWYQSLPPFPTFMRSELIETPSKKYYENTQNGIKWKTRYISQLLQKLKDIKLFLPLILLETTFREGNWSHKNVSYTYF